MPQLPVVIRGDANAELRGIAALIEQMPVVVQPVIMPLICQQVASTRSYEEFVHVNAVPKVQKRAPGAIGGGRTSIKQTITVDTYEVEMEIDGDSYDDAQMAIYSGIASELAVALILSADELVTTNLVGIGSTLTCFDNQNFYDTDHTWPNGEFTTSQVNYQTGTGVGGDNIENDFYLALNAMQLWKDDRGRLRIPASDLLSTDSLMVHHPVGLNQMMHRVFGATPSGEPFNITSTSAPFSSATAPFMRTSALSGRALHIADGYLTGNSWYVHNVKNAGGFKPFAFLDREGPRVEILAKGTEHFTKNRTVLIKGTRRFGLGVLRPERSQQVYNT